MSPLVVAQGILAAAPTPAVLPQQRGPGLGGAFGGEVTAYRSRRGIERTLFRLTIGLAVLFVIFSLLNLLPTAGRGPRVGGGTAETLCYHRPPRRATREVPCRGGGIGRRARFRT